MVSFACVLALACLACRPAEPMPEAPTFSLQDVAADPDIGHLISRRYDVAAARPHQADAWTGLGFAFEANDFHSQAVLCYRHAEALRQRRSKGAPTEDNDAKNLYRLGVALGAVGDLAAAVDAFAEAAALRPDLIAAHWQRANYEVDLGRLEAAESSYRSALQQRPTSLPARLGLARLAIEQGQLATAEGRLQKLLGDIPELAYARFLLADVRRQLGQEPADTAASGPMAPPEWPDPWQQELQDLRVGFAADMRRAEEALAQGRADAALPLLEELRRKHPEDISVLSNLSAAYIGSGRAAEAIPLLDAAHEKHPERFTISMNLAAAHFAVGDLEQALTWALRAQQLDPQKARPLEMQGEIHTRRQDFGAARRTFEQALQLSPDDLQTLQRLAWIHERAGRWDDAHAVYLHALQVAPQRGDLAYRLGGTLYRMGRPKDALQALDRAKQLGVPPQLQEPLEKLSRSSQEAVRRLEATQSP